MLKNLFGLTILLFSYLLISGSSYAGPIEGEVTSLAWERNVCFQELKSVKGKGFTVPDGAHIVKIYKKQVGTERKKIGTKKIQNGTKVTGTGKNKKKVKKYKIVPVYKQVSKTKIYYYYTTTTWVNDGCYPSSGSDQAPYWSQEAQSEIADLDHDERMKKIYSFIAYCTTNTGSEFQQDLTEEQWKSLWEKMPQGITFTGETTMFIPHDIKFN